MASRQVALLRGINVGRANRVTMVDLRALFETMGYIDVRTLLNSGNVVFTSSRAASMAVGRLLGDAVTSRNWATMMKLHSLIESTSP